MYEENNPASDRVVDYVRKHLPANIVFDVLIPRTVATTDAFAAGQPVVVRTPADAASQAYVNLATLLANRLA
jgi:chromosome partitioning protein